MESVAWQTLPHAMKAILQVLVVGQVEARNGTLACTDSYAARYGFKSRETVQRALAELERRGFIVRTRQGMKMKKMPTLWAVTWWPIYNDNGWPLDKPRPPTYAYRYWRPVNSSMPEIHTDGSSEAP